MTAPRNYWNVQNIEDQKQKDEALTLFLKDVYNILNKGITPSDNFRGALLEFTFTALNTNVAVKHGLNFVPRNYLLCGQDSPMIIYDGSRDNDLTYVYLRAGGTTGIARVFVF